jgi:hypothetical protein
LRLLRSLAPAFFLAAFVAAPAIAAPRTIDDCEKIEAADAYNQCLALFGPVARGHAALAGGDAQMMEMAAAKGGEKEAAPGPRHAHRSAARHARPQHHAGRHAHSKERAAWSRRGHQTRAKMVLSVVSPKTRLR